MSELVKLLNERSGTDFTEADQLFFDQIEAEAVADEGLKQAAQANHIDDFKAIFDKSFEGLVIDRMEGNEAIFARLMSDPAFRDLASEDLMRKLYKLFNPESGDSK